MKKSIAQVETGIAKYIDEEFVSELNGFAKIAFSSAVILGMKNAEKIAEAVTKNELAKASGIVSDGLIDIDLLKDTLTESFDKCGGSITQNIPIIGATTFTAADVEEIYRAIHDQ